MSRAKHIDDILRNWRYEPNSVVVRMVKGKDGREVIQMRIEMGVLQLEIDGRPDGARPGGAQTYYDLLLDLALRDSDLIMTEDQCAEVDREFMQFYHRRICWLAMRQFQRAMRDADHTLGLMDFCRHHSPDEQWTLSHEQYRPFVMFHRIQAAALSVLEDNDAEAAIQEINRGLKALQDFFDEYAPEEDFEQNELVMRLMELREAVRERFSVGRTLEERLDDAIAAEQYELAARLRDQLAARRTRRHSANR